MFTIAHMKMRRGVIIIEHGDNDTKETTEFRHPHLSEASVSPDYAKYTEKSIGLRKRALMADGVGKD